MFGFSLRVLPDEPSNPTAPKGQNEVAQGLSEAPPRVGKEKKVTQIGYATLMVIGLNR
jgi:hypothetical protein